MFSLREDIILLDKIGMKGEKSDRQIYRELVIEMNRSDEALKTRYKSYLKPLSELDKAQIRNCVKDFNPDIHCAIILKEKDTKVRTLKEIVKNEYAGPPKHKVRPPTELKIKTRTEKPHHASGSKSNGSIQDKIRRVKQRIVLNAEELQYLTEMARLDPSIVHTGTANERTNEQVCT